MINNTLDHDDIPKKFKCPLTNKLMKDPVMAFDECTYEREAIHRYLQKCKKSPRTHHSSQECCTGTP